MLLRVVAGASNPIPKWLTLFAGPGLGLGISSLIWFAVWCRANSASTLVPLSVEFIALLAMIVRLERKRHEGTTRRLDRWSNRWLLLAILFSTACAFFHFERFLQAGSYGGWDAWAIWNLHAKALFTGGGRIWKTELHKIPWTHPDYPLLLPLTVARFWFLAGRDVPSAPALVATYYTFAIAGVIAATLNEVKGSLCATLGVVTVLASNQFLWVGFQEYADVPISFYILTAFSFLIVAERSESVRLVYVAGFSAGLAAWTKNEGSTFLACLIAAHLLLRRPFGIVRRLFAGAVVPVAVNLVYKRRIPAQSDVLSWLGSGHGWSQALHPDRLLFIMREFGGAIWKFDSWLISAAAVLIVTLLLTGIERTKGQKRAGVLGFLTAGLLLLTYVAVYATSPTDLPALKSYLDSSLDRLYVQLWPTAVLSFFLIARTPFEGFTGRKPSHPQPAE